MSYLNTFLFKRTRNKQVTMPLVVTNTNEQQQSFTFKYPAVLVLNGLMTIGDTPGQISENMIAPESAAINKATYQLFTEIRSKNSSVGAYVPADVMKYLLSITSIEVEIIRLIRDCGLMMYVSTFNAANPKGIKVAFDAEYGYDCDNTIADIANVLARIQICAEKFKHFATIPNWTYAVRAKELASIVYMDEQDKEVATWIVPHVSGFKWNIQTKDTLVGALTYLELGTGSMKSLTISKRLKYLENLIDVYATDDDVNNLSAEMYKAYGVLAGTDIPKVLTKEEALSNLKFVCDINMLEQVRNATIYNLATSTSYTYGVQENDRGELVNYIDNTTNKGVGVWPIAYQGTRGSANFVAPNTPQLVLYTANTEPTDTEVINTLLFKSYALDKDLSAGWSAPCMRGFGTVVLYDASGYWFSGDYNKEDTGWEHFPIRTLNFGVPASSIATIRNIDCLPDMYYANLSGGAFAGWITMVGGSTDVYTTVSKDQVQLAQNLITMSNFALISGFGNSEMPSTKPSNTKNGKKKSRNGKKTRKPGKPEEK